MDRLARIRAVSVRHTRGVGLIGALIERAFITYNSEVDDALAKKDAVFACERYLLPMV